MTLLSNAKTAETDGIEGTVKDYGSAGSHSSLAEQSHLSFLALYKEYLSAFNEHDPEKTLSFISPEITICIDGCVTSPSREKMISSFSGHWEKLTQPIILHGEPEEFDDGVKVVLDDRDARLRITVRYHFREEEGKWLHIRHEIGERVTLPKPDEAQADSSLDF